MSSLIEFRNAFLLGQATLADWLGVSRTLLSLAETNRKSLSASALVRFSKLKQMAGEVPADLPPVETSITFGKKARASLQRAGRAANAVQSLRHQIRVLEEKMVCWQAGLQLCRYLKTLDWVKADQPLWEAIDRYHEKTWITWCEKGPRQLKILRFYLSQSLREQEFLEELAEEYRNGTLE